MNTIPKRLDSVYLAIQNCQIDHGVTQSVQLLAVSKTKPAEDIESAYQAGQRQFGENYVQEGVDKIHALKHLSDIQWHFIGPLQSNKSRLVAEHFDWVQSVDREKIARRLSEQRPTGQPALNVLIQINISHEASKSGLDEQELLVLAEKIAELPNLTLRGLMTIGSNTDDDALRQQEFLRMHALFERLKTKYDSVDTLSMGMSGDWQQAIACGATMIRLGTAIFGQR